ncbi:MAG: hypothetical protein U1E23_14850 [Reyranellaceae bacterium]
MTASASYVPEIVRTLRRYHGRHAPRSLCERIAGGRRAWRVLNEWWDLDGSGCGRAAAAPRFDLGEPIAGLSMVERRIALQQIADECDEAGFVLPGYARLAECFGVSRGTIARDLAELCDRGIISARLVGSPRPEEPT